MTGFRAEVIWPVVLGEEDWHTLAAAWRREHPEIRGVSWTCTHSWHPPTDTRGPLHPPKSNWKPSQSFSLGTRKAYAPRDAA